jgi:hypothetical protein
MFATKGFMLALHVPASFAKDKNRLTRALYRIGKSGGVVIDVKKEWTFINDIRQFGINTMNAILLKHLILRIVWLLLSTKVIHMI